MLSCQDFAVPGTPTFPSLGMPFSRHWDTDDTKHLTCSEMLGVQSPLLCSLSFCPAGEVSCVTLTWLGSMSPGHHLPMAVEDPSVRF